MLKLYDIVKLTLIKDYRSRINDPHEENLDRSGMPYASGKQKLTQGNAERKPCESDPAVFEN